MVATRRGTTPPPPPGRGVAAGDHRVVEPGRGLLKAALHLVSVCWDPFLNGTADPSRLAPSSDRVAWWRCPNFTICGTVRLVSVRSKVASYRSAGQVRRCRKCVARERGGTGNTLAAWLPEAAAALVPTRENPLAAEVLSRWYPHKVTWRCLRESSHPLYGR